jgi:hypothetical protein
MFEVSILLGAVMMRRMRNKPFLLCVCVPISNTVLDFHDENKTFFMKDEKKLDRSCMIEN